MAKNGLWLEKTCEFHWNCWNKTLYWPDALPVAKTAAQTSFKAQLDRIIATKVIVQICCSVLVLTGCWRLVG